jgi:hypothetical protein
MHTLPSVQRNDRRDFAIGLGMHIDISFGVCSGGFYEWPYYLALRSLLDRLVNHMLEQRCDTNHIFTRVAGESRSCPRRQERRIYHD